MRTGLNGIAVASIVGIACQLAFGCGGNDALELVGTLERTQIELIAPVSEVIIEVLVERGQEVEAEQTIARLDPTLARAEARRADAELARARTADRVAIHELERTRELRQNKVASDRTLERVELERDEASATLRAAEASRDAALKRLDDLNLRAPAGAVIDQLPYERGERVPAGAVLAVLQLKGRPWIRVWLPEPYLAQVRPGVEAEVSLDGWPDTLRGRVLDVAREPTFTPHFALTERERAHLAYETRVELLDEPEGVRPGVPATVRLPVVLAGKDPRLPIPRREEP